MREPRTHCAMSLSGVQMTTCSTSGRCCQRAVAVAIASSASNSTIGQTTKPSAAHGALGERELREQVLGHALAGLVAVEQIVAERLDHVVEGDADVGDAGLAQQEEHRAQEAAGGADLAPCRPRAWGAPK